ncbi:MAG: YeeE/YedE thiosulfate transporter family protein [Stellaceae bacterium]
MENFTPLSALIGGALIGLAAVILWAANGRVAGISGIVGGLVTPAAGDSGRRIAFLLGLCAAPLVYWAAGGGFPSITISSSLPLLVAGGLLVGFGTRLGGGCTSGHGVCGMARLSPRSLTATVVFMTAGFAATFAVRHLIGG